MENGKMTSGIAAGLPGIQSNSLSGQLGYQQQQLKATVGNIPSEIWAQFSPETKLAVLKDLKLL
jgi:hypothetical protein